MVRFFVIFMLLGAIAPLSGSALSADMPTPPVVTPVYEGYATTSDGVKIYYREVGAGTQVVLAPHALYHGTALDLLAQGRKIVTFDPRGRGRSSMVAGEKVSLDLLLSDVDAVAKAVGAERFSLLGWSGSGMEMFVYTLRNPDKVERLVQLAPVPPRFEPYGAEMMADREARTDKQARATYRALVDSGEFENRPAEQCRAFNTLTNTALLADHSNIGLIPDVCDSANEYPEASALYFGALFQSIVGFDWMDELEEVTIPRLVIHPLQDNISRTGNEEWVRGQPNARIIYIDNSGHFPQYEQPEVTLQIINAFLGGDWPSGAKSLSKK